MKNRTAKKIDCCAVILIPNIAMFYTSAASGEKAEVVIMNTNENDPDVIDINGTHEQYYELDSVLVWTQVQDEPDVDT